MGEKKIQEYLWVAFYIEFANKLLAFANDRKPLVDIIKSVYEQIGINLPKLEKDGEVFDIDPFPLFGLFNKSITTENRIKIITAFDEKREGRYKRKRLSLQSMLTKASGSTWI